MNVPSKGKRTKAPRSGRYRKCLRWRSDDPNHEKPGAAAPVQNACAPHGAAAVLKPSVKDRAGLVAGYGESPERGQPIQEPRTMLETSGGKLPCDVNCQT